MNVTAFPIVSERIAHDDPARLSIERLSLTCFRNYRDLCLTPDAQVIVLTGHNGSGKTNLLEAVSLLAPGRGLRRAALGDLQHRSEELDWAVAAALMYDGDELRIGTGRDARAADETERRLIHIDGKATTSQAALSEYMAMVWLTPDMDRLLADGATVRRKFLDRLATQIEPPHAGRLLRYEKAMRQRLRLLTEGPRDAVWLAALEDEMAQSSVALAASRRHLVADLNRMISLRDSAFPHALLSLTGFAETALDDKPALLVEDDLRAALAVRRSDDTASGQTNLGAMRAELLVHHIERDCPAHLCSTGEQKALMICTLLAFARLLCEGRGIRPLLLLDDIVAHLDDKRRDALCEEILDIGGQCWLTGTDEEAFAPLSSTARFGHVENGRVFI